MFVSYLLMAAVTVQTWFEQRQWCLQPSCRRTYDGERSSALPATE